MSQFARKLRIEIEGPSRPYLDSLSKQMRDRVLAIAKNNNRTLEEAEILYRYIKNFHFFEKYLLGVCNVEEEGLIYLCKTFRFRVLRPRELVFKEGDPSNGRCYLVFSGEVLVVKEQMDEIIKENIKKTFLQKNTPIASSHKRNDSHYVALLQSNQEALKILSHINKQTQSPHESKNTTPTNAKNKEGKTADKNTISRKDSIYAPASGFRRLDSFKEAVSSYKSPKANPIENIASSRRGSIVAPSPGLRRDSIKDGLDSRDSVDSKKEKVTTPKNKGNKGSADDNDINFEPDDEYGYVKDRITWGGFFGERAVTENSKRGATIVAARTSEVLWFHYEDFKFVKRKYDKQKRMLLKFLTDIFPSLEQIKDDDVKEGLIYVMDEKSYDKGRVIVKQDDKFDNFYVVFEGEFEISKEFEVEQNALAIDPKHSSSLPLLAQKSNKMEKFRLCELGRGMIFGEEILINDTESYEYSVTVSSAKGTLLIFDKKKFAMRFPKEVYDDVLAMFNRKKKDYMEIVDRELQRRNIKFELRKVGKEHKLCLTGSLAKATNNKRNKEEQEKIRKKYHEFKNGDYTGGDIVMKKELMFNSRVKTEPEDTTESYLEFLSPRDVRIPPKTSMHVTKLEDFKHKLKLNLERIHNQSTSRDKRPTSSTKYILDSRTDRSPSSRLQSARGKPNDILKVQTSEFGLSPSPLLLESARHVDSHKSFIRTWEEIQKEINSREQTLKEVEGPDPKNLKDIEQFRLFPRPPDPGVHASFVKSPGSEKLRMTSRAVKDSMKIKRNGGNGRDVEVHAFQNLDHMTEHTRRHGFGSPTSYAFLGTRNELDNEQPDLNLLSMLTQRIAYATPFVKSRNESISIEKRQKFKNMHMEQKSQAGSKEFGKTSSIFKDRTYTRNSEETFKLTTRMILPKFKKKPATKIAIPNRIDDVDNVLLVAPLSTRSER